MYNEFRSAIKNWGEGVREDWLIKTLQCDYVKKTIPTININTLGTT
jgi:hypothetical protein